MFLHGSEYHGRYITNFHIKTTFYIDYIFEILKNKYFFILFCKISCNSITSLLIKTAPYLVFR